MKDLFLIIDMQNAYLPGQPWSCPNMPKALKNIQSLLDHSICGTAFDAVFTRCLASEDPTGRWKAYNQAHTEIISSTYLNQLVPNLQSYLIQWPLYNKFVYSSLSVPEIKNSLADYRRVLVTGVCAECCVLSTALDLIDAGAYVIYLKDAVAGQNLHFESIINSVMESFSPIHVQIMTTKEYLASLSR